MVIKQSVKPKSLARDITMFRNPNVKPTKCMAVLEVKAGSRGLLLSHVEYSAARATDPTEALATRDTLSSAFWGCKEFSNLYQYFNIANIQYQYMPSVPYTWGGNVAIKVIDDPLDESYQTTINQFVNAPSSLIVPVSSPSNVMRWAPRTGKKYCYSTYSLSQNSEYPTVAWNVLELNQSRSEGFGKLTISTFDLFDATGATPAIGTTVGKLIVTMNISYSSPIPINQTGMVRSPIYQPALSVPVVKADEIAETIKQTVDPVLPDMT